jgi:hypothetical protein
MAHRHYLTRGLYILRGHDPVREPDLLKWGEWLEKSPRWVAQDTVELVDVSTVFLGLDHGLDPSRPVLFETMVFGGELDRTCERYCTWDEAEAGHKAMLDRVVKAEMKHARDKSKPR